MKKILLFTSILFLTITTSLFAQHPTNLVSSNITSASVDLSWDDSVCGASVNVRYRVFGSGNTGWVIVTGVSSPYPLTGLLANTNYQWSLKCVGTAGWSPNESFTTSVASVTGHPTALVASNITLTSADLSWDASVCGASVNLRYRVVGTTSWTQINTVTSTYSLTGLLANTDYQWTVKCAGTSGWQANELFTTTVVLLVPAIDTAFISQPALCYGGLTDIQVDISQTAPPTLYTCIVGYYSLSNPSYFITYESTNPTNSNSFPLDLLAGDYCIRIVDLAAYQAANGGITSGFSTIGVYDEFCITISDPDILVASTSFVSSNLCIGDCIAAEDLLISGGTGPYSFTVNGGSSQNITNGDSTYLFTNLCAGQYDIVVTDANGCSTGTTFTISTPAAIVGDAEPTLINLNYNVSCNGASDGGIFASATGGTGTFLYAIDGSAFQSSDSFNGLTAGTYTITYQDDNNCIFIEAIQLIGEPDLSGNANVTADVTCYESITGEITFNVDPFQPGIPSYQYSIDNGVTFQLSNIFPTLIGNLSYDVIIKDNNNCQDTSTVYLPEPEKIIYLTNLQDVDCFGLSTGEIVLSSTSGGTGVGTYTYQCSNGSTTFGPNSTGIFPNLTSGNYDIIVEDAIGCSNDTSISIDEPLEISVIESTTDVSCNAGSNGTATLTLSGGTGTLTVNWFGMDPSALPVGIHSYSVSDVNGCTYNNDVTITQPIALTALTSAFKDDLCLQNSGRASITVSGGTGDYLYSWNTSPTQITDTASNLEAGVYTVDVTDENNCQLTETVTVLADLGFTLSFTTLSPCLGDSSGSATVSATGIAPYLYEWSDSLGVILGETSDIITDMPLGTYSVKVTDLTTCAITGSIEIIADDNPIVIDSVLVTNSSCYGINDAQIEIFASGGEPSYEYSKSYGFNTQTQPSNSVFDTLTDITYVFSVTDDLGCFDDTTITLVYTDLLSIDSTVFTHISCFGLDDGAVQNIQFVGGTGPFEFSIDGGPTQTYMLFSDLDPGQHTVEVEDVNNCVSSDYITIVEPPLLEVEVTASNWNNYQIRCNGDSLGYVDIISSGGTAPYLTNSITFSNIITIDSLWADNHIFVIQDANGCEYQEIILFNEPSPIQHNFISTHINCAAWNNGTVIDSVYGGVGSATTYSYLWDSGETTYSLSDLTIGTYTITVTDENGCVDTASVTINADNVFQANEGVIVNVGCFDDCDGELNVIVSGGVPFSGLTYSYLWNDFLGQSTATAVGLCVDTISLSTDYTCIVTDAVGCVDTVYLELEQPAELQVDILIEKPISCNGENDGKLKAVITGGVGIPNYIYEWNNGDNTENISDLSPGIYKVTVQDANSCRDTFEIYLNEPTEVEISLVEFDIACFGDDGSIEVLGSGGTSFEATYSYILYLNGIQVDNVVDYQAGSISQTPYLFDSLDPGNYYVIAKDRNGCEVTSLSVEITEPFAPLTLLVDKVDETCDLNDGVIRMFPAGGSQSFNYFINENQTLNNSNIIGGNAAGWYAIKVTDTRGCEINDSIFIKDFSKIFLPDTLSNIDTTICLGQSIIIDVDEKSELTYTWNDGVETGDRIIMPEVILAYGENATVYYTLTITDPSNTYCLQENIVVVHLNSIDPMLESDPAVEYGVYPIVLAGNNINLFSENNSCIEYTWQWSDSTITNSNGSITIPEISETDWYYLKVKDADGCLGYDSIYIVVGVKPYEAITPNNDGFNDTWTPLDIGSYQQALVQVFNRWGGLVFESNGGDNYQPWDRTNNGKELAVGTYYYIIELNTGDDPQTGPITIIR